LGSFQISKHQEVYMKAKLVIRMALIAALVLGMAVAASAMPNFTGTYPPILDKMYGEATGVSGAQTGFVWTGEKLTEPVAYPKGYGAAWSGPSDFTPVGYEVIDYDFSTGRSWAF
jgi:hypothetical protein